MKIQAVENKSFSFARDLIPENISDPIQYSTARYTLFSALLFNLESCYYLVDKSNTNTEKKAAKYEHGHILGVGCEDGADEEDGAPEKHGETAAKLPGDGGGEDGGNEGSQVEGGGKDCEELAVKHAVLVGILLTLQMLVVDRWEELFEERVH